MSNVSASRSYLNEYNRHNITIDLQGFISPPPKLAVVVQFGTKMVDLV